MKNFILLSIIFILCCIAPLLTNAVNPRVEPCPFTIDFDKNVTLHFSKDGKSYKNTSEVGYFTKGEKTLLLVVGFCGKTAFDNPWEYTSYIPQRFLGSDNSIKNVITVEYSALCCAYYRFISDTIFKMGEYVAGRLLDLGLTPDKIVGVGHSVGCHILDSITTAFENRGLGKIHVVWGMCPAIDGYVGWPEMKGLNPGSADTVVHVYTDNKGPFIPRGSINYFINPGCELQPGCNSYECNHIACLTVMGLAFHPASIANQEAFIGDKCFQDLDGCFTSDETSKLAPSSVAQKGCFCPNVDNKPPYYKKPSQPICSAK